MAYVALRFGIQPWEFDALDSLQRMWFRAVAIWDVEKRAERDHQWLEAFGRIMKR